MKVLIDAHAGEIEQLASKGLLGGATVLERKTPKRRRLSRERTLALHVWLDTLRLYKTKKGSFDVPRDGPDAELGEWLDKLKETYIKAPDGYRISFLREHAPDVLAYLTAWAKERVARVPVRAAPFWMNAAWAAAFMEQRLNAPSQASLNPQEVALAKWLSRWTSSDALQRLSKTEQAVSAAMVLDDIAQRLRSRNSIVVAKAREEAAGWRKSSLYQLIGLLALMDTDWMSAQRRGVFERAYAGGLDFWPTSSEWKASHAVWIVKVGCPRVTDEDDDDVA